MASKNLTINVTTYGILALAGGISFTLPDSLPTTRAQSSNPNTIAVTGIIRDFKTTHPDFSGTASNGLGHVVENISPLLAGSGKPIFTAGTGWKVANEWKDTSGRLIMPAGYRRRGGLASGESLGFRLASTLDVRGDAQIDAFNSNFGTYGVLGNYGARARITTNSTNNNAIQTDRKTVIRGDVYVGPGGNPAAVIQNRGLILGLQGVLTTVYPMPEIDQPDDLSAFTATEDLTGAVTLTGDTNPDDDIVVNALYYGTLNIKPNAKITIVGDLRIYCTTAFKVDNAQIVMADDNAQLTVYVGNPSNDGDLKFINGAKVNVDPGDTTAVTFYVAGNKNIQFDKTSTVYATIVAPDGKLNLKDDAHFAGGCVAKSMALDNRAQAHADLSDAKMGRYNFALTVRDKYFFDDKVVVDSFDYNLGPYGGANVGSDALVWTNSKKAGKILLDHTSTLKGDALAGPGASISSAIVTKNGSTITGFKGTMSEVLAIPVVTAPSIGASQGDKTDNNTTITISAYTRFKRLKLDNKAIINVSGNVIIRCDDQMEMDHESEIRLNAGASLTLYVAKNLVMKNDSKINANTGDPKRVMIRRAHGKKSKVDMQSGSKLYAWIQGAKTELKLNDQCEFFGSFCGDKVTAVKSSKIHVDMADLNTCVDTNDIAGTSGASSNGDIQSASTFEQWFTDVPGTNMATAHVITLTKNGSGVYEYLTNAFWPIDGKLLGNQGAHNSQFTYAISADFTYSQCTGQFQEFQGGDGAWMFINNQLAMDLGGMGSSVSQFVNFDRLGLVNGNSYRLDFFYSQRQTSNGVFRLRTNVPLSTKTILPPVTAAFD
jgi:fibro-slime domain-containing protein